jgi:acylphosphatase
VEYYNKEIAGNANVELIWATADNDQDAMEAWAKKEKFPWPTIKFKALQKLDVIQKLAPRGVPGYVLVDAEGEVLASSAGSSEPVKQKLKELTKDTEA